MECCQCGGVCYYGPKRKNIPQKENAQCEPCGGEGETRVRINKAKFSRGKTLAELAGPQIWSCPIHGIDIP